MPPGRSSQNPVADAPLHKVIKGFMASARWTLEPPQGYSMSTKISWRRELELLAQVMGDDSVYLVRSSSIQAFLDGLAGRPGKQKTALAAIRQMECWALVRDFLPHPISIGVRIDKSDGGHLPWNDEQVALGELHASPEVSRAITLKANTGQRGSDLVRMRWNDIETIDGRPGINVAQKKTRKVLWVPFTAPLQAAMATWERRPGPILLQANGRPWSRAWLANSWQDQRDTINALAPLRAENLRITARSDTGLVLHGLRGTACVRLKRAGATIAQIADMVGMSVQMVERYCRFADQRQNALAAVIQLDRTSLERRKQDRSESAS